MQPSRMRWLSFWALLLASYNFRIGCADDPIFAPAVDPIAFAASAPDYREDIQASEVASTSDIESADSANAATISDAEPQPAADPSAADKGDSMADELRLLRAELEKKNGILDEIERKKNKEILDEEKAKLIDIHHRQEDTLVSIKAEKSKTIELKAQLQNQLLEAEEKLQFQQTQIQDEVHNLAVETKELLEAKVMNETEKEDIAQALVKTKQEEVSLSSDSNEEGINQLSKLMKKEKSKAPSGLNQTLQDTHGELATVVAVHHTKTKTKPSPHGLSNSSDNGVPENDVVSPPSKLIDSDHNEYVLVRTGSNTAETDKILMRDLVTLMVAAALAALVARIVGLPTLLGYILVGSCIGPSMLSFIESFIQVETLAQLGVTFLLFALGLEMSFERIRAVWKVSILGGGTAMMIIIWVVMSAATYLETSPEQALFVGCFISMSSTSVVLKSLESTKKQASTAGNAMVGILIFQDLALGVMLAVLPTDAHSPLSPHAAFSAVVSLFAVVACMMIVGRVFIARFIAYLVKLQCEEVFILNIVAICLICSALTEHLGFSTEIGAFIAGFVLASNSPHVNEVERLIGPVRDIFAALFFTCIGVHVDIVFILGNWGLILALLGGVLLLKGLVMTVVVRVCKYPIPVALMIGLGLAQIGEFSFILASNAKASGMLSSQVYLLLVHTTVMGLLLTPVILSVLARVLDTESHLL